MIFKPEHFVFLLDKNKLATTASEIANRRFNEALKRLTGNDNTALFLADALERGLCKSIEVRYDQDVYTMNLSIMGRLDRPKRQEPPPEPATDFMKEFG